MEFIHTCLRVLDLEQSLDFYVDKIGFKLIRKTELEKEKATLAFIAMDEDGPQLELTYNWDRSEPYTVGDGFSHIALLVEDLDGMYDRLKEQGCKFYSPPKTISSGTRLCFVTDPDGYDLELIQVKK
jgi:lactoylglutathione lyase